MPQNLRALEHARELDAAGLNVLPAIPRDKRPAIAWEQFQTKRTTPQLAAWFGGSKAYNFWIATGQISGVAVLDCDSEAAVAEWQSKLDGAMSATTCVKTARGYHWWFRINGPFESWDGPGFNVRGDGTGVLAPPSVHPDGPVYEWIRGLDRLVMAPEVLRRHAVTSKREKRAQVRTGLTELLSGSPSDPHKGNDWMTQVAGHYAKWIPFQDAFEATIRQINSNLKHPIAENDIAKLIESIWTTEHEKLPTPSEGAGWLRGTGSKLMTLVKRGDETEWAEWANFDLRCRGVIHDENDYRSYVVDVLTPDRIPQPDLLEPDILGSPPRLQVWLTSHGVNVVPPLGDPRKGSTPARLQRYLESQEAPISRAAPWLGLNEGHGFITHDGRIGAGGLEAFSGVIPHPRLRGWAPYRYGFVSDEEARGVLNEVLTFQEEELCSIFGAWWAACFLKGQPDFGTSLWPYIALEAPSESGKTRGFFSLMIALTGNTEGHGESTTAALRDKVSAHRNGPVWIDDLSDIQVISEILRQATSEGSRTKKGQDRHTQESVKLVAPIVVSGESMGAILSEKAQRDRAIHLIAHSPTERMSLKNGAHPQWDDILDLLKRYDGDLTKIAGSMVRLALQQIPQIALFRELRGPAGRHNDKIGVLRVGARVLSAMTLDELHITRVDAWCARQEDLGQENVLTTRILTDLPGIIQETPVGAPAIFIHNGIVYFNENRLAQEWEQRHRFDRRALALGSLESIRAQRVALGITGDGKRFSILGGRGRGQSDQQVRYHQLSPELSALVLERAGRASGALTLGAVSRGVSTGEVRTDVSSPLRIVKEKKEEE